MYSSTVCTCTTEYCTYYYFVKRLAPSLNGWKSGNMYEIEYVGIRDGNGPGRPRAGPENPGPRALRAETGLMIFYLRVLCALCANRWVVTRELYIVVTCKCVVY